MGDDERTALHDHVLENGRKLDKALEWQQEHVIQHIRAEALVTKKGALVIFAALASGGGISGVMAMLLEGV